MPPALRSLRARPRLKSREGSLSVVRRGPGVLEVGRPRRDCQWRAAAPLRLPRGQAGACQRACGSPTHNRPGLCRLTCHCSDCPGQFQHTTGRASVDSGACQGVRPEFKLEAATAAQSESEL